MELLQKNKLEEGQTLLIVVLVMVISLTVGLSIASKTITNLRTSTEEVSSAQALSAAETGVSQSIKSGGTVTTGRFVSNNTTFNVSLTSVSGTIFLVNGGTIIPRDEGTDVWLIPHNGSSLDYTTPWPGPSLTIYWGDSSGGCNNAALEIIKITGPQANPVSTRYGFDPCSPARTSSNGLTSASSSVNTVSGKTFYYSATIGVTQGFLVRIIPLYANTILAVKGTVALPSQGSVITSTGKSSNVERRINVVQNYYSLPSEFFSYGLFVPN